MHVFTHKCFTCNSGPCGHISSFLSSLSLCGDGHPPRPIPFRPFVLIPARFLQPRQPDIICECTHAQTHTLRLQQIQFKINWTLLFLQFLGKDAFDSSILDFWAASGLMPQTNGSHGDEGVAASCDSFRQGPAAYSTSTSDLSKASLCPTRQLRQKKAVAQLHLTSPRLPPDPPKPHYHISDTQPSSIPPTLHRFNDHQHRAHNLNLTSFLTLSGENKLHSGVHTFTLLFKG